MTPVQLVLFNPNDWSQRWNARVASWRPKSEGGFDARRYTVEAIEEATAREFVERHHYSGSYPADKLRFGMFEGRHLVGVQVLGVSMGRAVVTKPFPTLVPFVESMELSRLVLLDEVPANAESWFVAQGFERAAKRGLRGVVAFSDPLPRRTADGELQMPGHIGTVYKALNGRYTGRATRRSLTVLPDGRVFSARSRAKVTGGEKGADGVVRMLVGLGAAKPGSGWADDQGRRCAWLSDALQTVGVRTVRHLGNHRYVFKVGARDVRRRTPIGLESKPFPTSIDEPS